jgi:hypothetical protein
LRDRVAAAERLVVEQARTILKLQHQVSAATKRADAAEDAARRAYRGFAEAATRR